MEDSMSEDEDSQTKPGKERVRDSPVWRAQKRIRQMEAKIKLVRQKASRNQCVIERDHHTLSQAVLVVVKQHCLDRIWMLMTANRSLVAWARGLKKNRKFSEGPSRLFQQRPPVIEQPPTAGCVEAFWRDLVFNWWLSQEQPFPAWFVEGRPLLLPQTGVWFQILQANIMSERELQALHQNLVQRILEAVNPEFLNVYEQRRSKNGVAGCKENLLIDRCVTQDYVQHKRNLSMAWINYRKAFDTTSHELIVRLLECLSVDNKIMGCIKQLTQLWKTRFTITSGETRVRTELVTFKRGVFQGDSSSPLLFCISLLPLSITLKNTKDTPVARSITGGTRRSAAIGMEFGTDKCAMVHLKKGRCGDSEEEKRLVDGSILRQLHAGDTYTYLGVAQRHVQDVTTVKECFRRKYLHRLRQIWSSELSGKNKVAATNMLAVPLLLLQ
nr:unnamed protein product [Callosobruchus analis]